MIHFINFYNSNVMQTHLNHDKFSQYICRYINILFYSMINIYIQNMGDINLRLFLKKYTSISSTFIDKHCSFYDLCEKDKFGINVDLVVKYLEYTDSKRFYRRFRKTYTLNEDYVIKKNAVKAEKDVKLVEYFITIECFEKICMGSRSKMGNSVRDYFITLRQFINYYKNHIADTINHMAKPGKCVYIILANKNKNIQKIGRTENLRNRLKSYVTGKETHNTS